MSNGIAAGISLAGILLATSVALECSGCKSSAIKVQSSLRRGMTATQVSAVLKDNGFWDAPGQFYPDFAGGFVGVYARRDDGRDVVIIDWEESECGVVVFRWACDKSATEGESIPFERIFELLEKAAPNSVRKIPASRPVIN